MNAVYPVNEPTTAKCRTYIHTLTVFFGEGKFSFSRYEKQYLPHKDPHKNLE
jgi:hypothetical protein